PEEHREVRGDDAADSRGTGQAEGPGLLVTRAGSSAGGACGLSAACVGFLLCACAPGGGRPRNLLLISIDTLRADHLSCYGHERPPSPALDALAARGVRFADATAAAPWTLPSHATMLTGLYPSHHGVKTHETRLAEGTVTLADEFQAQGFRTL